MTTGKRFSVELVRSRNQSTIVENQLFVDSGLDRCVERVQEVKKLTGLACQEGC